MCGIVGYVGTEQAAPILLAGLSKLEYRGYDSAGIAIRNEDTGDITVVKAKGRLKILSERRMMVVQYRERVVSAIHAGQRTENHRRTMHIRIARMTSRWYLFIMVLLKIIRN